MKVIVSIMKVIVSIILMVFRAFLLSKFVCRFKVKVVSQKMRKHCVKGGDAEKYEDYINICSFVQKIRNWDMICDYYVEVIKLLVGTKLLCTNI